MVSIGISEFTFGYAFLFEQTIAHWNGLEAAPILPSLQQEANVGWDARIPTTGVDFYYQFKLAEYLSRSNASFIADGTYDGPYYRLALHRRNHNQQHQRLRQHAAIHPQTYYVAPEFNNVNDFNAAFLGHQVAMNSRLIPLSECDHVTDRAQHYITYQPGNTDWDFHSKRKRHSDSETGKTVESLYRRTLVKQKAIDRDYSVQLFESTRAAVEEIRPQAERERERELPLLADLPPNASRVEILRRTADILSVAYGLTLVIVGPPNP